MEIGHSAMSTRSDIRGSVRAFAIVVGIVALAVIVGVGITMGR
jgi:hypothetical protein